MTDKSLRDEAAELVTEAVRELRDGDVAEALRDLRAEVEKLRAERAAHTCHSCHGCTGMHIHCNWGHCGCWTVHSYSPYVQTPAWYGTVTAGGSYSTVTTTNAASGYNPTLSLGN
jgi:hypothetical protein